MSNLVEKNYPIDMAPKEIEALEKFIADGLPGIAAASNEAVKQALELYFNGAGYTEISQRTGLKKVIITYLSTKHGWYDLKLEMLKVMVGSVSDKAEIAHVKSIDLLTDLMFAIETYYRDVIERYRKSRTPHVLESTNMENLKVYMKCMEQIQKFRDPSKDKKPPLMGLNLPDGGTLKKIDDNTIEVSPQQSSHQVTQAQLGKVLETLAELRREREGKK